jgi:hypothetical protein
MENIKATFGKYLIQLSQNWIDGFKTVTELAQAFMSCDLVNYIESSHNQQLMLNVDANSIMQVKSITNISISQYDQEELSKYKNWKENYYYEEYKEEVEYYAVSKSLYSLVLTDGAHDVQALLIEYPDISGLVPGAKILLIPKYIISEGIMILANNNFEILKLDKLVAILENKH